METATGVNDEEVETAKDANGRAGDEAQATAKDANDHEDDEAQATANGKDEASWRLTDAFSASRASQAHDEAWAAPTSVEISSCKVSQWDDRGE